MVNLIMMNTIIFQVININNSYDKKAKSRSQKDWLLWF